MPLHPIDFIVSGGQTGADRAGFDAAIELGIPHKGWCPKGRKAEDGRIPDFYQLTETPSAAYLQRTAWNVRDSDATVIFTMSAELTGGSLKTKQFAQKAGRPVLHLHPGTPDAARELAGFLEVHFVRVLNVAGSRGSKEPKVGELVRRVLTEVFTR